MRKCSHTNKTGWTENMSDLKTDVGQEDKELKLEHHQRYKYDEDINEMLQQVDCV